LKSQFLKHFLILINLVTFVKIHNPDNSTFLFWNFDSHENFLISFQNFKHFLSTRKTVLLHNTKIANFMNSENFIFMQFVNKKNSKRLAVNDIKRYFHHLILPIYCAQGYFINWLVKAVFTLAEFIEITPVTVTSDTHHCSCLGHLGLRDTDRIVSISCRIAQGGLGKNILCRCRWRFCQNNITNVNDP
jgi:hypothetical protein